LSSGICAQLQRHILYKNAHIEQNWPVHHPYG
jgi:hypothetical protein